MAITTQNRKKCKGSSRRITISGDNIVWLGRVVSLFFLLTFYDSPSSAADQTAIQRVQSLTLQGLEHAFNLQVDSAYAKFDSALLLVPGHPRPWVSKVSLEFWRFALANDDKQYEALLPLVDKAIEATEDYLDDNEDDPDVITCLGTLYGYRAFAHGRHKNYLKAAWDGKKSFDYFNDALHANSKMYDAYLGLGCFHYFTAFLPKTLQWMVSILGISGDANLGIREVTLAMEKGTYTKAEAQYYLAQFLPWQSEDFETSESLLVDLQKQYPRNTLISFTLAVWEIRRNDILDAKNLLLTIVQNDNGTISGLKNLSLYKLGECYFRLNDYNNTIETYKSFLGSYKEENYQATSHFRIGLSYEMKGQRSQALKHYQASVSAEHKHGDDSYSARKAKQYLASPLSHPDTLLIKAKNDLRAGRFEQALQSYRLLDSLPGLTKEHHAEARYGIGETLYEQAKYADAMGHFQAVLSMNVGEEQWLIPWAHYQIAICHKKLGNNVVAKSEFQKVVDYDDEYDFKGWLHFRAERELEKLK